MRLVLLTVLLSAAAGAQTPATTAPVAAPARADKMICRYETGTGTIFPGRICKLRSQWAVTDRAAERAMENRRESNTIDRAQGCTMAQGGC